MTRLGRLIRYMAVLMTLCMIIAAVPDGTNVKASSGESFKIDGEWWTFDKSTGTITWVPYAWKGVEIPSEIDGTAVKSIGDWAV